MQKHIKQLVKNMVKPSLHNVVKRNTMRLLQQIIEARWEFV